MTLLYIGASFLILMLLLGPKIFCATSAYPWATPRPISKISVNLQGYLSYSQSSDLSLNRHFLLILVHILVTISTFPIINRAETFLEHYQIVWAVLQKFSGPWLNFYGRDVGPKLQKGVFQYQIYGVSIRPPPKTPPNSFWNEPKLFWHTTR